MAFSEDIIKRAWERQGGCCAACCKELVWANRDHGEKGAWHAHHRILPGLREADNLINCVLLCINPPDCHSNVGHDHGNFSYPVTLSEGKLPCFHHKKE